jgi:Na+-driven multidrug efflux pump
VIFVSNAAFNNLGRPFISTWNSWGRHTLGTIPFVIPGGIWFGPKGILIGQAAGGLVLAAIALVVLRRVFAACAADDTREKAKPFQRHTRLMQIFSNRR